METMVETYKNEHGEIAVLVSGGYGAGWSTWNCDHEIAWDKRMVELYLSLTIQERRDLSKLDNDKPKSVWARQQAAEWGYTSIYWGGFDDCSIEWVPAGKPFRINEYDGAEDLEYLDMEDWVAF